MHSNRMHTARLLTISRSIHIEWGLLTYRPVHLRHGIVGRQTPRKQTDACENITFPKLRLRAVIRTDIQKPRKVCEDDCYYFD